MKKNILLFVAVFAAAIMAGFFNTSSRRAYAYTIGSSANTTGGSSVNSNYDFGSSLQNLVSPFTGFVNNLRWNNGTSITTNGMLGYAPPQNLNIGPTIINALTGWLGDFNNWVYAHTGIKLSGIIFVFLSVLAWILHLAGAIVGWLLGLFH